MEKARIFISYKRKNKKKVFSIVNKIESQLGVKCWIDLDGIESSSQFRNKICNAIDNSDIVLFMHSSVHLSIDFQKDWTIKELGYAEEKGKKVILIKLDDAPLDKDFLMEYGTKNNIDSRDETQFQKLLRDLKVLLDLPQQAQNDIKYNENNLWRKGTSSSFITKIYNRIKNWSIKTATNTDNEYNASSSNRKQKTEQDNTQASSSKFNKIYDEDGNLLYEGEMKNEKYHGQGTLYSTYGGKYVGQFLDGKFHGQGTRYFANGDKYEGEFENNEFNGQGILYLTNGGKYEGEFEDGEFHGQGTRYFTNGEKYTGEFENGEFNGKGTYYFADGNKYVGGFQNDRKHGYGTFYYANGTKENVIYDNDNLVEQRPWGY